MQTYSKHNRPISENIWPKKKVNSFVVQGKQSKTQHKKKTAFNHPQPAIFSNQYLKQSEL